SRLGRIDTECGEHLVDATTRLAVLIAHSVRVGVERDSDVGMAEALLHDLVVANDDPADRLRGVAHSLRSDAGNAGLLDQRVHQSAEVVRVHPAADGGREDETGVDPGRTAELRLALLQRTMAFEHRGRDVAERDDPVAVLGLKLLENRPAPLDRELLYNLQLVLLKIDVHPSKGQNLTSAQARDEPEMERCKEA